MEQKTMAKTGTRIIVSVLITALLVSLLIRELEGRNVFQLFRQAELLWVGAAFCAYALCYLFRAVRFRTLLQQKLNFPLVFSITALHNLFTSILPFRSGELSYPYLLSRKGIGTGEGIATLVLARIFDFLAVAIAFLAAVTFVPNLPPLVLGAIRLIWVFLGMIIIVALLALFASGMTVRILQRIIPPAIQRSSAGKWLWKKLKEIHAAMVALRGTALWSVMLSTAGIWILQFLTYAALLRSMHIPLSFAAVILLLALVSLASAIPIQGFGNIGTNEAYWTVTLMALGIGKDIAITAAFAQHFYVIIFYVLLGAIGSLLFYYNRASKQAL